MRIEANSVEELIEKAGDKKEGLIFLDQWIQKIAPGLKRWLLKSDTYVMIGYGKSRYDERYSLITLAPQKNFISLYIMGEKDGELLTKQYKDKIGKVTVGKSCIQIKNTEALNLRELENLILDSIRWNEA